MKNKSLYLATGSSLLIHSLLLAVLLVGENVKAPARKEQNAPVVVEIIESAKPTRNFVAPAKTKQIVEQSKEALNDEVAPDAKYLSRHNQKVVKETVAAKNGKFQNDGGRGEGLAKKTQEPRPAEPKNSEPVANKAKAKPPTLTELVPGYSFKPRQQQLVEERQQRQQQQVREASLAGDGRRISQSQDHLAEVDKGMQTLLTTREFVYYSYYQRIRNQLSQHWESRIKEKIKRMYQTGRQIASEQNKVTKVMIVLDHKGTLIGVQVMAGSGVHDLDDAAVEAFRAAAPFPNPPDGIAEADGTIKIRWDFVLEA